MSDRVHREHLERLDGSRQRLVTEHRWLVEAVVRRYRRRLRRQGVDRIDDARQQAYLALVLAARTYRVEDGPFVRYAYGYCMGAVLRGLKKEGRHVELALVTAQTPSDVPRQGDFFDSNEEGMRDELKQHARFAMLVTTLAAAQRDDRDSPEQSAAREQAQRMLRAGMSQIDEHLRRVLELHFFGDRPMVAVADELEVSYPTAIRHRTAAINALRQVFERPRVNVA